MTLEQQIQEDIKAAMKAKDTVAKAIGDVGIPCYVLEDGAVTLYSKDVGLEPRPEGFGAACRLDGKVC